MRSVIPFETEAKASRVDEILLEYDWMIGGAPDEPTARREFWQKEIDRIPTEQLLKQHQVRSVEQLVAEQNQFAPAVGGALTQTLVEPTNSHDGSSDNGQASVLGSAPPLFSLAADEAREIIFHISRPDKKLARITFQYPIFDRQTQTFGTVHYEPDKHHIVIRLKNSHSEKLKLATERLAGDLIRGKIEGRRSIRIMNAIRALAGAVLTAWFRMPDRHRGKIALARIKVLEPGNPVEAFSGTVIPEKSLASVVHERRSDVVLAGVFLSLGLAISLLSSPILLNFDYQTHTEHWINGWVPWFSGNMSRIGSAFFVAVFLPIIQILLHWRAVRRKPSIDWNIDVPKLT